MTTYIIRRLLLLIPVLYATSLISFGLTYLLPGDPAVVILRANGVQNISQESIARVRQEMGLDDPFLVQHSRWLLRVIQLDFGKSVRTGTPVAELILTRLPATLQLSGAGMLIALLLALPLGIVSAIKQNSIVDQIGRFVAITGASMPSFWLSLLLIYWFAVVLDWLPALGYGEPAQLILPSIALSMGIAPTYARLLRASLIEAINQQYIVVARAKGLRESFIIIRHALPNAIIPFITYFGISLAHLVSGAVVIETIFSWPGVGKLIVDAILTRDFFIVQAFVLISATAFVLINFIIDLLYLLIDPRIRIN